MPKINMTRVRRIKTSLGEVTAMKIADIIWRNHDSEGNPLPHPTITRREQTDDS